MLNIGAYRAGNPHDWKTAADPFGPENSVQHLADYIARFKPAKVVVAWGKNCKSEPARLPAANLLAQLPKVYCWGRNTDGTPKHPGSISLDTPLVQCRVKTTVL
jgi:hypothetical protein